MYPNAGQALQAAPNATPARPSIHPLTTELGQRIYGVSCRLDKTLARLRGSQPVAEGTSSSKQDREISTNEFIQLCHQAMNRVEEQLSELEQVVG